MTAVLDSLSNEYEALIGCREDLVDDPYPLFARMRTEAPIYRHHDQVAITRYEDVKRLLADQRLVVRGYAGNKGSKTRQFLDRLSVTDRADAEVVLHFRDQWIGLSNGAQHTRLREITNLAFTPKVVQQMETEVLRIATDLLDEAAQHPDDVDLVRDFAWQLPLTVMCELLDVPVEDRHQVRAWSSAVAAFDDGAKVSSIGSAADGVRGFTNYLSSIIATKRAVPTTDLMGSLVSARTESGDQFTDGELAPIVANLLLAGHETTTNLVLNALHTMLVAAPDQWRLLVADPSLAPSATEEALRHDTSVVFDSRIAVEDFDVKGAEIRQWDTISLIVGAANRDPDVFADPDRFDMTRKNSRQHVAFGFGPFYCLGASLARLEIATAFRLLATRFPDLHLNERPQRSRMYRFRGFDSMPADLGVPQADG